MIPEPWRTSHPDFPWLSASDPEFIARILSRLDVIDRDASLLSVEKAGEGNMNLTLRVTTDNDSVILKQSRPWVEKYPQIEAPWDRALAEQRFYTTAAHIPGVHQRMPDLLAADAEARILVLEDIPEATDLTDVYHGIPIDDDELRQLGTFAASLHAQDPPSDTDAFANREMRRLNHQHIFIIPLQPGAVAGMGLDLDALEPGLAAAAALTQADDKLLDIALRTGDRYLADGPRLVHGDYFPGSFLRTPDRGIFVIDPEFGFLGDPSFDLAVFVAHLALASQPQYTAEVFLDAYLATDNAPEVDPILLARYAACETIRRIIGVAQLPLPTPSHGSRADLLLAARAAATTGRYEALWA
ncbi:phosphotransferase [Mucisphaera sp.]|uniref:phosphotransferase n=1 Tax=Mucisphaera sp. TaxID=2913024 RepID=UPI003D14F015